MYYEEKSCLEAEKECVKIDAHLASIHSAEENEFIATLHVAIARICIGGRIDGNSFRWMDGSDFNYQNWYTGEPNNLNGNNESCIELYFMDGATFHGKWNDIQCDYDCENNNCEFRQIANNSYVCKKDKLGMQSCYYNLFIIDCNDIF